MIKAPVVFLCTMLLFFAGCTTIGREISDEQIAHLEKGKTSISEAVDLLGRPTTISAMSDGRKVVVYSFAHVQPRPETFIPFAGALVGGADVRSSALILTFDSSGVLRDYTSHKSFTGSGSGFAAGAYQQPDRDLPQESAKTE